MPSKSLPDYSPLLEAYHAAFAPELQSMIQTLPLASGDSVLDMGCGDGTYTGWLADRVAPNGYVTAVDFSREYLTVAKQKLKRHPHANHIRFKRGNIKRLPFPSNTFAAVWCAQSLVSFPDPLQALKELARVARPNGVVAILENDTFHQVLLPWPVDVELALSQAQVRAFYSKGDDSLKAYVGRDLRRLFVDAGLRPQRKRLFASQREDPFSKKDLHYLRCYLKDTREKIEPFLPPALKKKTGDLLNPESPRYLLNHRELTLTCLDHLVWGKKP